MPEETLAGPQNLRPPPLLQENRAGAGLQMAFFRCGAMAMAGDRTGHKPEHGKLPLNVQKYVGFAVRVVGHSDRWPKEVVGSPSMEMILKSPTGGPALGGPAWSQEVPSSLSHVCPVHPWNNAHATAVITCAG